MSANGQRKGPTRKMNLETLTEREKKTIEPTSSLGGFTGFYYIIIYYIIMYYYIIMLLFIILCYLLFFIHSFFMNSSYSFFKRLF